MALLTALEKLDFSAPDVGDLLQRLALHSQVEHLRNALDALNAGLAADLPQLTFLN